MFSGIVEAVGEVAAAAPEGGGRRLTVRAPFAAELGDGESVALDGVCQTVVARADGTFDVLAVGTTLSRTTLGSFEPGRRVNLERSLRLGDRLGGHLVQGHVDATGVVVSIRREREHVLLDVRMPEPVAELTVLHGSIAINGVSLTVNDLEGRDVAQVALIPYTWEATNLSALAPGDAVNLEGDMLGKFVVAHLRRTAGALGSRGGEG